MGILEAIDGEDQHCFAVEFWNRLQSRSLAFGEEVSNYKDNSSIHQKEYLPAHSQNSKETRSRDKNPKNLGTSLSGGLKDKQRISIMSLVCVGRGVDGNSEMSGVVLRCHN